MIAITGATGHLGQRVVNHLLETHNAQDLVAIVRNPAKAQTLADKGVQVREADYGNPTALASALQGVEKLLLISSSEVGQRAVQHRNIIDAAKSACVKLIAYTSLLRADTSPLGLHVEHVDTENYLAQSGVPYVLLRNGWYSENYMASVPAALEHGAFIGSAGEGKIASASREDYAEAAAKVLSLDNQAGKVYELAGDSAWTLAELTEKISALTGKTMVYHNLSEADFAAALQGAGLPEGFARLLADSDIGASQGGLFDDSRQLSRLIGRPTTSIDDSLKAIL